MTCTIKKLPDLGAIIITVPNSSRGTTAVPGIGWSADIEVLVFKDEFSLATNLSELGACFAVDSLSSLGNSSLSTAITNSVRSSTDWVLDKCYLASPLEILRNKYKMISYRGADCLFKCSSTTIYDSEVGTFNCLEACTYQIDYLMGQCNLGMPKCAEGLDEYVTANKEITS